MDYLFKLPCLFVRFCFCYCVLSQMELTITTSWNKSENIKRKTRQQHPQGCLQAEAREGRWGHDLIQALRRWRLHFGATFWICHPRTKSTAITVNNGSINPRDLGSGTPDVNPTFGCVTLGRWISLSEARCAGPWFPGQLGSMWNDADEALSKRPAPWQPH